MTALHCGAINA